MAIDKVWTDLEWHPEVHVRLGEHLHYYLVRVRPFRAQDVESKLDEFLKGSDISSLRVFMIFGPMDLLVRVWLNPRQAGTFHTALSSALSGADVRPFFVNKIVHRSHVPLEVSTRLLDTLDDSSIRAVQNGQDETLREDLLRDGLIVQRRNNSAGVKFFVGVSLALNSPEITNHAIKKIESYLADQNSLVMPSIYVGVGFCDILVKADADETFFSLGDFVLWLGQELRTFHPTTDTYISAQPGTLVEVPDTISDTTFRVFEGESLFVRAIIPELYLQFYSRKRPIEQFLETEISDLKSGLTEGDRLFLHDYLLGHLQGRSALGSLLYGYFTDIEEFLRAAHKAFAGRAGVSIGDLYRQIGFDPATTKHIPLGHLVEFCARVSVAAGGDRGVTQGWNEWTLIRNRLLHGDWHPEETWSRDLTVLLQQQARLQSIASHIHRLAPQKAALKLKFIKMARPTEPRTKEEGDPASSAAK